VSSTLDPWGAIRDAVEAASQDETISPDARLAKLRLYRDDLNDLLGRVQTYVGGLELIRDARPVVFEAKLMEARQDADIRVILLERGLADEETLDALLYVSHDELDRLEEEHRLDEWIAERDKVIEQHPLEESFLSSAIARLWDSAKHPRGAHGRFTDGFGRPIVPKGRHGKAAPKIPGAPGGERGPIAIHHEEKHTAFVAKAAEFGKHAESHPSPGDPAERVLQGARDTQDLHSWLEPLPGSPDEMAARVPSAAPPEATPYEGPQGMQRRYTDERMEFHDAVRDLLFRQRKRVVTKDPETGKEDVSWDLDPQGAPIQAPDPEHRTMIWLAGGTASGKSVSRSDPRIANSIPHPQDAVTIDPDELKQLFDEYHAVKNEGDESAASITHEESSDLAKRILGEAMSRGMNVVMDGTGNSGGGKFPKKIQKALDMAKEKGHKYRTKVLYFDAPVDVALEREHKRSLKTGRKVPEATVRAIHAGVAANYPGIQQMHEQGLIDDVAVHDTTDGPHLIAGDLGPQVPRIGGGERVAGTGGDLDKPINVGDDVEMAAKLLAEGKQVELNQPIQVSTLLDKLAAWVKASEARGEKPPVFDLGKVSVKGTNLFAVGSKGVPRIRMPQFKGTPEKGSRADKLPKNEKGRVSLDDAWRAHLKLLGIRTAVGTEKAANLRATQRDLNGANAARFAREMKEGRDTKPIFISREGYILDGHHQWAGRIGLDSEDGKLDLDMPVERIDLPITELLAEADRFTKEWGLKQQGLSTT
jgi:predicted kinase